MWDALKDFLGLGSATHRKEVSEKIAAATAGLDLQTAIAAHENWKVRLEAFLEGRSTEKFVPEEICFDNRCDLGKWIHGPGKARIGTFAGFTALLDHHKMFHYAASNVVALAQAGKHEDARHMLDVQFSDYSRDVVRDLRALQAVIEDASRD